jgi:hypothetical protein
LVALVFMLEEDAQPWVAKAKPLRLEVRAIVAGAEKVLLKGLRVGAAPANDFDACVELAGKFLAHGVLCIAEGDTLIPMIAHSGESGTGLNRVVGGKEHLQGYIDEFLKNNPPKAKWAAVVLDAFVTIQGRKVDALVAQLHELGGEKRGFDITLPYRPKSDPAGFAVFKPKFALPSSGLGDTSRFGEAFFRGVDSHEEGAKIWNKSIDQTF